MLLACKRGTLNPMTIQTQANELAPNAFSHRCPSRGTLHHLTGRWGALTMAALAAGPMRFGELRRRVDGISDRMLAQTLGQLERDGMVARRVFSTIPPHVEYSTTELGSEVAEQLGRLIGLVEARMPDVLIARAAYDRAREEPAD